jgi:hypothetical protein
VAKEQFEAGQYFIFVLEEGSVMSQEHVIEAKKIRELIHGLNNALNVAKMNAYLLRSKVQGSIDGETMDSLDQGLEKAESLLRDFCHLELDSNPSQPGGES